VSRGRVDKTKPARRLPVSKTNKRASDLTVKGLVEAIKTASEELPIPTIEESDEDICVQMAELIDLISGLARSIPRHWGRKDGDVVTELLHAENEQLIRFIGCISQGGKDHIEGWRTLLNNQTCREALVFGIIGRALKEHVFNALYFGCDEGFHKTLSDHELKFVDKDGK
jgi:hypothetical protein